MIDSLRRRWRRFRRAWTPEAALSRAAGPEDGPLDVLAAKLLFSHLRNRQQLLGPPPTAFGQLDDAQSELLIRGAVAAARAGGRFDETEARRLRAALASVQLQSENRGFLQAALSRPVPLDVLLRDVRDPHAASLFYAASVLACDRQDAAQLAYLGYLAVRLHLPAEVVARVHAQFGLPSAAAEQPVSPAS